MKITDKIVTSVTQPQQTNVLWHNPETGELKMFGNKGWEVVGGSATGGVPIKIKGAYGTNILTVMGVIKKPDFSVEINGTKLIFSSGEFIGTKLILPAGEFVGTKLIF